MSRSDYKSLSKGYLDNTKYQFNNSLSNKTIENFTNSSNIIDKLYSSFKDKNGKLQETGNFIFSITPSNLDGGGYSIERNWAEYGVRGDTQESCGNGQTNKGICWMLHRCETSSNPNRNTHCYIDSSNPPRAITKKLGGQWECKARSDKTITCQYIILDKSERPEKSNHTTDTARRTSDMHIYPSVPVISVVNGQIKVSIGVSYSPPPPDTNSRTVVKSYKDVSPTLSSFPNIFKCPSTSVLDSNKCKLLSYDPTISICSDENINSCILEIQLTNPNYISKYNLLKTYYDSLLSTKQPIGLKNIMDKISAAEIVENKDYFIYKENNDTINIPFVYENIPKTAVISEKTNKLNAINLKLQKNLLDQYEISYILDSSYQPIRAKSNINTDCKYTFEIINNENVKIKIKTSKPKTKDVYIIVLPQK